MNAVVKRAETTAGYVERIEPISSPLTPMAMLSHAVSQGANVDVLEKLMALSERWEKNQARKAFDDAMASAKAEMPVIFKNRVVDFTSAKGRTHYRHEDLAEIARTIDPILARHGLSYRYRTTTTENGVTCTCIVSHRDGHFEENTLSSGRDESGNKNSIQAVGSALTFLQRYTLKASVGLAASADDDGRATSAHSGGNEPIGDEQVREVSNLITATKSDLGIFLKHFGIASLPEITAKQLPVVLAKLSAKRAQMAEPTNG